MLDNIFYTNNLIPNNMMFVDSSLCTIANENFEKKEDANQVIYTYNNGIFALESRIIKENDLFVRRDSIKNISGKTAYIRELKSCFALDGGEYSVYTQQNCWQHESVGGWQPLVSRVKISNLGIRLCDGTTPIMAIKNEQSGRILYFNLQPNCHWQMNFYKKLKYNKVFYTVLETGFEDLCLNLELRANESVELPEVIFYETFNQNDFDAYKMHEYFAQKYPRRELPVLYNSWLYNYDNFTIEEIFSEIDMAGKLGIEKFMIDAGWFGARNDWSESVGDWQESKDSCTNGRLIEIAQRIRANGMKFGLWFEPERAGQKCQLKNLHPEFYINGRFFDFSNAKAREMMVDILSTQIEKYGIEFIKFDFNDSLEFDPSHNGFYYYFKGQNEFINALKEKYPNIYFTNCASGGQRMEASQGKIFDSFWLSDNQSQIEGMRIIKDSIKRMPSTMIERWNVLSELDNTPIYGNPNRRKLVVSCGNGTWDQVEHVSNDFIYGFVSGGPFGSSFNLCAMSDKLRENYKSMIERYKKERDFYIGASCRILCDRDNILVLQYSNKDLSKCVIKVFSKMIFQDSLTVYPVLNKEYKYKENYTENGIVINGIGDFDCREFVIEKI